MIFVLKLSIAIVCAVLGALAGTRWIDKLYHTKGNILSFPHKIFNQSKKRPKILPACLGILFSFYLLTAVSEIPTIFFHLLFIYFLVLYTLTDVEQQVIFDVMLIPFACCGFLASVVCGFPLTDQLIAALGGGVLFLIMAVLTKGGIGGGDIKLIAALGLWLGVSKLTEVIAIGLIGGGIGALLLLLFGHKKKTDTFAYGPFFTLAAIIQLFFE